MLSNIQKIEKFIKKYAYGYKQPELFINLTYKCPLRCKFCYVDYKRNNDFNYEDLEYIFENIILKTNHIKLVTFFGGEPLLKIDFIEKILNNYYEKCCQQNIHLAIITSLSIHGEKILELQSKYPLFEIVVSFDNYSEERIYANNKPFKVLEHFSLNELQKHKRNLCFHIVIDNENSFKDLKLCQSMFDDYGLLYSWCWNKTPYKTFDVSSYYDCLEQILIKNKYYPKQFCNEVDKFLNKNAYGCGIGSEMFISSNGDISPCSISHYKDFLLLDKGNIKEDSEELIQYYENNIFNNEYCNNCSIKGFCNGGCIVNRLSNDFNIPNKNHCYIQHEIYKIYEKLDKKYDLKKIQSIISNQTIGNIDYCHNTSINIDMYDYFNL